MNIIELRIGNLVQGPDGVAKVEKLVSENRENLIRAWYIEQGQCAFGCREDSIKGIPLTEEWLIRMGFDNPKGMKYVIYFDGKSQWEGGLNLHDHGTDAFFVGVIAGNDQYCSIGITVKYVHQLQNLYFALTEKELEIKDAD